MARTHPASWNPQRLMRTREAAKRFPIRKSTDSASEALAEARSYAARPGTCACAIDPTNPVSCSALELLADLETQEEHRHAHRA